MSGSWESEGLVISKNLDDQAQSQLSIYPIPGLILTRNSHIMRPLRAIPRGNHDAVYSLQTEANITLGIDFEDSLWFVHLAQMTLPAVTNMEINLADI